MLQMEGQRAQVALGSSCPCLDTATPKRPGKASVVKSSAVCKASVAFLIKFWLSRTPELSILEPVEEKVSRNSDDYTGLCENIIWRQALILEFRKPMKKV